MGQFSMEISGRAGSALSGNQHFLAKQNVVAMLLDTQTTGFDRNGEEVEGLAHGVIRFDKSLEEYGGVRRRVEISKLRGVPVADGYHASVTSIFQMTRRDAKSVDDLAMDFGARLQALSSFHTAVYEVGGEEVSLSSVVALTVSPYNATGYSRIKVSGPDLFLSCNAGMTIALCLHELMTNAIKFGSLSVPKGKVSIEWKAVDGSKTVFTIDWFETNGPMVEPPTRQGYGTRYVRSALGSLLGSTPEMIFRPEGFHCRAVGPVWRVKSVH